VGLYTPPWTKGQRRREEELPLSNIIGQVRFIPDYRSKAVLVLCPQEHKDSVRQMIEELDRPAKQVMVKATILAIDLKEETTIGVQLANDPTVFGSFTENSLDIVNALRYADTFGRVNLSTSMDVTVLIDFLVKNVNAKILNEPTLWAKDNEEATFFRGRTIPFISRSQSSTEGGATTQTFSEKNVGVTLRVRPNITPQKAIDMELNLIISSQEPDLILGNTATSETNTTTHLIVEDGSTILLSGILFQQDVEIERKLPLLGDIPLAGELFKHKQLLTENSEVMIFLTPYVIEDLNEGQVAENYKRAREKFDEFKAQINSWLEATHPAKG
jgi:general secretion pathway protein D